MADKDRERLQVIYSSMRKRCLNPNDSHYPRWGGRGIEVRFSSFGEFVDWALTNGYRSDLTIDRINNDGHYEPSNCRWATSSEQNRNRRDNVWLTAWGETKTVPDWADDPRCSVGYDALLQRVRKSDWTAEEKVSRPHQPNQMAARGKGNPEKCPAGHDLILTRVWNSRGDYYCKTCKSNRAKTRYREAKAQ